MKRVNDKKPFKTIQLRDLSEKDSNVIKEVMKLTNEKRASKALLKAAAKIPVLLKHSEALENTVGNLELQNKKLQGSINRYLEHQTTGSELHKNMRKLIDEINKTIDTRQTTIQ